MKTRANLGSITLAGLGIVLCFSDFASAADSSKNVSTYNQRTGAVTGQLTATFGDQFVYCWGETVTLTPLSGGQATTTKTNEEGRFLFQNVPAGQYELRTQFEWYTTYVEAYDDGTRDRMYVGHSRALVGRVTAKTASDSSGKNLYYRSDSGCALRVGRPSFQASPSGCHLSMTRLKLEIA